MFDHGMSGILEALFKASIADILLTVIMIWIVRNGAWKQILGRIVEALKRFSD